MPNAALDRILEIDVRGVYQKAAAMMKTYGKTRGCALFSVNLYVPGFTQSENKGISQMVLCLTPYW